MSQLFLTKTWGFIPEEYPALGFSTEGGLNKTIGEVKAGDWIIIAGTMGEPTPIEDQGRLLGKIKVGTTKVDVEAVLASVNYEIPKNQYNESGEYRWRFGLPMIEAHRFKDKPKLLDIFGDNLSGNQWATYALALKNKVSDEIIQKIHMLPTFHVDIIEAPEIKRQRNIINYIASGNTGPGPSGSRSGSDTDNNGGFTYLLSLKGVSSSVYKIGYSRDINQRVKDLNSGLLKSIKNLEWEIELNKYFDNVEDAYKFEQALHSNLKMHLISGEREVYKISETDIKNKWWDAVGKL